ncbi:hypothetical protein CMI49_01540 [Candidatus Pacearchaeota archaeon]|jgi:adenylate kinase family enzyme|nr:hypothetical protein [Candidatus Pacearchaeota archaeon]|tara:strand:- start:1355 stop:1879 length:525 start_codon:yes stop_codon:yes gene_type:complete
MKKLNKIFILGTSGSGKTTLAKNLSEKMNISHYNLDDFFWYKRFSKKRNPKKRDSMILSILKKRKWIAEGIYGFWTEKFVKKSDLVIWLDYSFGKLSWRNIKRFIKQREKKSDENLKNLIRIIKYVKNYRKGVHGGSYKSHKEIIDKHQINLVIIKNNKQLKEFMKSLDEKRLK